MKPTRTRLPPTINASMNLSFGKNGFRGKSVSQKGQPAASSAHTPVPNTIAANFVPLRSGEVSAFQVLSRK